MCTYNIDIDTIVNFNLLTNFALYNIQSCWGMGNVYMMKVDLCSKVEEFAKTCAKMRITYMV